MGKINTIRKKSLLFLLVLFYSVSIFVVYLPDEAAAYTNNDRLSVSEQRARTQLYAIGACISIVGLKETSVNGSDVNSQNIYGQIESESFGVAVGHEIDTEDGTRECRNMNHDAALGFIGMTYTQFIKQIYNENGDGSFTIKDNGSARIDRILQNRREPKRQSDSSAVGPREKNRRVAVSLGRCIERVPDGEFAERQKVTINGKDYQYKDGKGSDDRISIGHDIQSDGTYTCETLVSLGSAALRDNPLGGGGGGGGAGGGGGGGGGNNQPSDDEDLTDCDMQLESILSWILCPVIDMSKNTTDFIFKGVLQPLLEDVAVDTNPNGPDSGAYRAWQGFRLLGNILLVGAMLILVYGAARGGR